MDLPSVSSAESKAKLPSQQAASAFGCLIQIASWSGSMDVSTKCICAGNRRLSIEKRISKTPFQEVD